MYMGTVYVCGLTKLLIFKVNRKCTYVEGKGVYVQYVQDTATIRSSALLIYICSTTDTCLKAEGDLRECIDL